jgi:ABC-2 type transport system permease protein
MTATWLIARRELGGYLRTMSGYVIAAAALFVQGILFNAMALGSEQNRMSTEVLSQFFWVYSGTIIVVSVLLSMRLLAEERQTGTMVLLSSSPVREREVVLGKFFSSLIFLVLITLPSVFMPLLILVNGKLSVGHVLTGYLGLFLLGSACLAIGTLGSTLAKTQLLAVIISGGMIAGMVLLYPMGSLTERPLNDVLFAAGLWHKHYPPFQSGLINLRDVVYYVVVTYFALFLAIRVLEARRWR